MQPGSMRTTLYGADLALEYRRVTWRTEWVWRRIKGDQYGIAVDGTLQNADIEKRQSGLYSELLYRFGDCYKAGVRYDAIVQNSVSVGGRSEPLPGYLDRWSLMAQYVPCRELLFRVQYSYDRVHYLDGERKPFNLLILQCTVRIGQGRRL